MEQPTITPEQTQIDQYLEGLGKVQVAKGYIVVGSNYRYQIGDTEWLYHLSTPTGQRVRIVGETTLYEYIECMQIGGFQEDPLRITATPYFYRVESD